MDSGINRHTLIYLYSTLSREEGPKKNSYGPNRKQGSYMQFSTNLERGINMLRY